MNRLKEELNQLWKWAKISSDNYKKGEGPSPAQGHRWTTDYLYWDALLQEVDHAMIDLNTSWNDDLADLLVLAISLDDGEIFNLCLEGIKDIDKLMLSCAHANQSNIRLRIDKKISGLMGEG